VVSLLIGIKKKIKILYGAMSIERTADLLTVKNIPQMLSNTTVNGQAVGIVFPKWILPFIDIQIPVQSLRHDIFTLPFLYSI